MTYPHWGFGRITGGEEGKSRVLPFKVCTVFFCRGVGGGDRSFDAQCVCVMEGATDLLLVISSPLKYPSKTTTDLRVRLHTIRSRTGCGWRRNGRFPRVVSAPLHPFMAQGVRPPPARGLHHVPCSSGKGETPAAFRYHHRQTNKKKKKHQKKKEYPEELHEKIYKKKRSCEEEKAPRRRRRNLNLFRAPDGCRAPSSPRQ